MAGHNTRAGVIVIRIQGSEDEILAMLWRIYYEGNTEIDRGAETTYSAILQLEEGNSVVTCGDRQYEILDATWSLEQDIYGCAHGRACTSATPTQRREFEAMIIKRASESGCDDANS